MSTPNEGPETAVRQPGLTPEAFRALGTMTPAQQQAMNHVVNAVKAVAPMINAVAKCIRGIRNTFARLSQAAQRLRSTDRALNPSQGGRHRAERSSAGQQATAGPAQQAGELSAPTREATVQARDRGRSLVRDAGMALAKGADKALRSAGRWAWSKVQQGQAVVGDAVTKQVVRGQMWANEKVVPVVQAADDKLTQAADWAGGKVDEAKAYGNQQMSRAAAKASATLAAFAERRNDPTNNVPGQELPKADLAFAQQVAEIVSSQNPDAAKVAELGRLVEPFRAQAAGLETAGAPAVEGGGQTAVAAHREMWKTLHDGQAAANTMSKPAKPAQATPSAKEQAPGAHTKKQGPDPTTRSQD
ncbi:hypothetical protein [Kribbella sp. DT2]|uniref:hypothetical protein n=1 Tax=Kribbella sp. DT2 TaxID=3393427 RepID=UPI003CEEF7AD